jgi:hypothetical protein
MIGILAVQANAQRGVGSWYETENVSSDSNQITKNSSNYEPMHGSFQNEADRHLFRDSRPGVYPMGRRMYPYQQPNIFEVPHQQYMGEDNRFKGLAIGAGIGVALGAGLSRDGSRVTGALTGGFLFGIIGYGIGLMSPARHHHVIF